MHNKSLLFVSPRSFVSRSAYSHSFQTPPASSFVCQFHSSSPCYAIHRSNVRLISCISTLHNNIVYFSLVLTKQPHQKLCLRRLYHRSFSSDANVARLERRIHETTVSEQQYTNDAISHGNSHLPEQHSNYKGKERTQESDFERRKHHLLSKEVGSWTEKDVISVRSSLGQYLALARPRKTDSKQSQMFQQSNSDAADSATKLLIRWMEEYMSVNPTFIPETDSNNNNYNQYQELIEYLYQVLHRWQLCLKQFGNDTRNANTSYFNLPKNLRESLSFLKDETKCTDSFSDATRKAADLLDFFLKTGSQSYASDQSCLLLFSKAYSIIFEILALEIQQNYSSTRRCLATADSFLQQFSNLPPPPSSLPSSVVWNSYLNVLAQSSPYVHDSPEKAEELLFQAVTPSLASYMNDVSSAQQSSSLFCPNTKSCAIVLNSWTRSPRLDATDRALRLFDKLRIISYENDSVVLDNVCYSTCIRALGLAGRGQEAEDLLWKMHQDYTDYPHSLVRPNRVSFLAVIQGWSKSKEPERAKAMLEHVIAMQQNNPKHNRSDMWPTTQMFTAVMDAYARYRNNSGPQVEALLHQMEELLLRNLDEQVNRCNQDISCRPNIVSYLTAIHAWARTSRVDAPERAEAIVRRMEDRAKDDPTISPNTAIYNALILAWINSHREDGLTRALSILTHMKETSIQNSSPNAITYTAVMKASVERGMTQEVLDLYDEMMNHPSNYCKPTVVTYNTVINALAKSKLQDAPERAEAIVREIEARSKNDSTLAPNKIIYNSLVHVWANSHRKNAPHHALSILKRMKASTCQHIAPDTVTYTAVMNVFAKRGMDKEVLDLYNDMRNHPSDDCKPTSVIYNTVITTLVNSKLPDAPERAEAIVHEIEFRSRVDSTLALNQFIYDSLIHVWANSLRTDAPQRALSILNRIKASKTPSVAPNTFTYTAVMGAFARRGMTDEVSSLFDEMVLHSSNLCRPNLHTYATVLKAWTKSKRLDAIDQAEAIVQQMELYSKHDSTLVPNTHIYNNLIRVCVSSHHDDSPQRALSILNRMKASTNEDAAPDTVTYDLVIKAFGKQQMPKEAHHLLNEMIDCSAKTQFNQNNASRAGRIHPHVGCWTTVISAYADSGCADAGERAQEVLYEMEKWHDNQTNFIHHTNKQRNPTSYDYIITIQALGRNGKYEEADSILWKLVRRNEHLGGNPRVAVQPDTDVCNAVLQTWSCNRNDDVAMERAELIWRFMVEQDEAGHFGDNIHPNAMTIKHLVCIWDQSKHTSTSTDWIERILKEIKTKYPHLLATPWLQPYL